MAEVVAAAVLPEAGRRAWEFVQEMAELSSCMKANYLCLEARMKTLCAHKDDMKERTTKYKSTEDRTMNDWFNKVDDAEKRAHELERSFRKKQKSSKLISARSRSNLSKQMAIMCICIDELVMEGHQLRDGPILQSALNEIQQDLKAIRVQGRKLHMVYIWICIIVILLSCSSVLFKLGSTMKLCPPSCYDKGLIPRVTRFISSLVSRSEAKVCPHNCYDEGIFPMVTRYISSIVFRHPRINLFSIFSRRGGPKVM